MTHKSLAVLSVPRAQRGDKKGWPTLTGQVRPETFERFERLRSRKGKHRSDAVAEAIEQYVERNAA